MTVCAPPLMMNISAVSVLAHTKKIKKLEMGLNRYSVAVANGFMKVILVVVQWYLVVMVVSRFALTVSCKTL